MKTTVSQGNRDAAIERMLKNAFDQITADEGLKERTLNYCAMKIKEQADKRPHSMDGTM